MGELDWSSPPRDSPHTQCGHDDDSGRVAPLGDDRRAMVSRSGELHLAFEAGTVLGVEKKGRCGVSVLVVLGVERLRSHARLNR
jgi:hypothetical protein